jgi:hypothetical protein
MILPSFLINEQAHANITMLNYIPILDNLWFVLAFSLPKNSKSKTISATFTLSPSVVHLSVFETRDFLSLPHGRFGFGYHDMI